MRRGGGGGVCEGLPFGPALLLYTSALWSVLLGKGVFRCPLVPRVLHPPPPSSPQPACPSARRRRFWFWIEGLSCRSGARASRWRSWAFSWADSARPRHAGRALCTWPLGGERGSQMVKASCNKGNGRKYPKRSHVTDSSSDEIHLLASECFCNLNSNITFYMEMSKKLLIVKIHQEFISSLEIFFPFSTNS